MLMVVLKSGEQFLAEIVSILIDQKRRKIICLYDFVNQEIN